MGDDGQPEAVSATPSEGTPTPRRAGYLRRLKIEWTVVLAVLVVLFAALGWALRPQSSGFLPVAETSVVQVYGQGVGSTGGLLETLTRLPDGGAQLELSGNQGANGPWAVVGEFGAGRWCSPRSVPYGDVPPFGRVPVPRPRVEHLPSALLDGRPHGTAVAYLDHGPVIEARLCWGAGQQGEPVRLNGAYLNAAFPDTSYLEGRFPKAQNLDFVTVPLQVVLTPNAGDTANFAVQSQGPAPRVTGPSGWSWNRTTAAQQEPVRLAAVDTSDQVNDQYHAFLSGILFGVAGGALIALLQELVSPLSRRREE